MAAAPTFCSEYSAFVEGVVKGARNFLENKPAGTTFCLPDLPVSDHAESGDYNLRRIGLLARLIDRMVSDEIIVLTPKSTPTTRDHYLFHHTFDPEAGFGKLTGTAWIKAFWNRPEFDQAASDAMTNIERFLNREIVSQEVSNVEIKTEMMSSQARPTTPVDGRHKRPRSNSSAGDSSSGSEPSSPIPLFSAVRRPASSYSASSPPDLEGPKDELFSQSPSISKKVANEGIPDDQEKGRAKLPADSQMTHTSPTSILDSGNRAEAPEPVTRARLPYLVSRGLADLRKKFPNDNFEDIVDDIGVLHVKCHDCPERLYDVHLTKNQAVSTFELHLISAKHMENVHDRVVRENVPLTVTPAVKARVEKLSTKTSRLATYQKLSRSLIYQRTHFETPIAPSTLNSEESNKFASNPSNLGDGETTSPSNMPLIAKPVESEKTSKDVARSLLFPRAAHSRRTATSAIEAVPAALVPDDKPEDFRLCSSRVSKLKRQYPDDVLELADMEGVLYVKCRNCKGQLIKASAIGLTNLDQHIRGVKHIENVFNQVRDGGNYLRETPQVKARIEALRTRPTHSGLYLRLTSFPYDQSQGSSGEPSRPSSAHADSKSRSSIDSGSGLFMNGKKVERNRQRSQSNIDLPASPSVAPQVGQAEPFEPEILDFVSPALAQLRTRFPDDLFDIDVTVPGTLPRTKCNDCPEQYFEISVRDRSLSNLKAHLLGSKHISNVHKRMSEQEKIYTITGDVTYRMERLRRQNTTVALYEKLIKTGAPRGRRAPNARDGSDSGSMASAKPSIPSSVASDSASPPPVSHSMYQSRSEPPSHASKLPAKRPASEPIADDVASKKARISLDGNGSQTTSQHQAEPSTAGYAREKYCQPGYLSIMEECVATLELHNGKFSDHSQRLKEQGDQVQQTLQMLGDIFDTGAAQNTALERMRTDTTEWIRDLEKENTKQKATIDRLRLDVRQQKDIHADFVRTTEARFERMAQDHKAQLGLVMDMIKGEGGQGMQRTG